MKWYVCITDYDEEFLNVGLETTTMPIFTRFSCHLEAMVFNIGHFIRCSLSRNVQES